MVWCDINWQEWLKRVVRRGPGLKLRLSLLLIEYIDRDFHRRCRSPVLKPVCGVLILGPAHSRPILLRHSISMVSYRSLQNVDDARSVYMVMNRADDASRFEGHQYAFEVGALPCPLFQGQGQSLQDASP